MISIKKAKAKKILQGIVIVLSVYLLTSVLATKIIYDSVFDRYDEEPVPVCEELLPLVKGREAHSFMSGDNRLSAQLYDGGGDSLVVIAPGFRSSAEDYLWQIKSFTDHGRDVFIFDNTGSCRSEGDSAVGFPQAVLDLSAALDYIEMELSHYESIFLFGHSRGGYAACCAVSEHESVTAVASVNGINSAMEGIMAPVATRVGFIAYGNYPLLWLYQTMLFDSETVNLQASEQICRSNVPVLVVQSKNDSAVPENEFSIHSHKDEITGDNVEYLLCDAPGMDGHTNVLFSSDGSANDDLMDYINDFYDGAAG